MVFYAKRERERERERERVIVRLCSMRLVVANMLSSRYDFKIPNTAELQWFEPRRLVYHGSVEHVPESAGISSKYDIRIISGDFLL